MGLVGLANTGDQVGHLHQLLGGQAAPSFLRSRDSTWPAEAGRAAHDVHRNLLYNLGLDDRTL